MDPKQHWESVYRKRDPAEVSWFQAEATLSLALIREAAPASAAVLDVGGGSSTLVDGLLAAGYHRITVLDISSAALDHARRRLGAAAHEVNWMVADILNAVLPNHAIDVWHDRAVFHFLTEAADRERYVSQVKSAMRPGGVVLVATFADDGPTRCSGLPVARYSARELHGQFGRDFRLIESRREEHVTPQGVRQSFVYCLCRYEPGARPVSGEHKEPEPQQADRHADDLPEALARQSKQHSLSK
jgi:SAM-dependent methyltransferase